MIAILVNTTDSFEDCWGPFFKLFKKYWPEFHGTIYLNTEAKQFHFDGLNIVSIQNNPEKSKHKPAWSECLLRALDIIQDPVILYMQEDYFLHDFVKNDLINEFAEIISKTDIDCIHLTDQATPGPFHHTDYKKILEIDVNAPYRISTQAALWRKDILKLYIRKNENAWQFEHYATKRASILKHKLYCVDTNTYIKDMNEIIPYIFTGIIRGMWNKEVIDLFKSNMLKLDYLKRGFYELEKQKRVKKISIKSLIILIISLQSELDLIKLKKCRN